MALVKLGLTTPTPMDERGATATEYGLLVAVNTLANTVDGLI